MAVLLCLFAACLFALSDAGIIHPTKTVCYNVYNANMCFTNAEPFNHLPVPDDPGKMGLRLYLFRAGESQPREITNPSQFNGKGLTILTHGFACNFEKSRYWADMYAKNLQRINGGADVIFFDWGVGAKIDVLNTIDLYNKPAANVRSAAAYLTKFLEANPAFDASTGYCIGHSLGAHLCGFSSKAMTRKKWGRITGLDAAGPQFEDRPATARLDKTDAGLVEDVHTSTMYGLKRSIGHIDFYVNGGHKQPGCYDAEGMIENLLSDPQKLFNCSHMRVMHVFGATFAPPAGCSFRFCRCASKDDFDAGKCNTCTDANSNKLGMQKNPNNPGMFFGKTLDKLPFCI